MTYKITSTRRDHSMNLNDGIEEAARVYANRDWQRGGQLESLQEQVRFLSHVIGATMTPLLEHNFITLEEVNDLLPYGVKIEKGSPE